MKTPAALLSLPLLALSLTGCEDQPWRPGLDTDGTGARVVVQQCADEPVGVEESEPAAGPTYLVWRQLAPPAYAESTGVRYETRWMRDGAEGPETLGTIAGLVLAHGDRVYRLHDEVVPFRARSCDGLEDWHGDQDPVGAEHVLMDRRLTLVPAGGGVPIEVSAPVGNTTEAIGEHDRSVLITGTVGPYLFVEDFTYAYHCGVHGGVVASAGVLDLRTGRPANLGAELSASESKAMWPAVRTALLREDPEELFFAPEGAADLSLTALKPRLDGDTIRIDRQVTVDTCYACSDGDWSSYTLSTTMESIAPLELRGHLTVPKAARAGLGDADEGLTRGFTTVSGGPASRAVQDLFHPAA